VAFRDCPLGGRERNVKGGAELRDGFSALVGLFIALFRYVDRSAWRCCAVFLASLMMVGCAYIEIHNAEGGIETSRHFGTLAIQLKPNSQPQHVELTGLGLTKTFDGLHFGYHNTHIAAMPDGCHLSLWVSDDRQLAELKKLIGETDTLCLAKKGKGKIKQ